MSSILTYGTIYSMKSSKSLSELSGREDFAFQLQARKPFHICSTLIYEGVMR